MSIETTTITTENVLVIQFPNKQSRIDFIGKLDRLFQVEGNDLGDYSELHSLRKYITYKVPDENPNCFTENILFDYYYNGQPFSKNTKNYRFYEE
jgi:hypothetical protein